MWATFDKPVLVERVDDESDVWARGLTELCELIMRQGFGGATEVRTLSRPAAEAKRFVKVAVSCSHRRTVASPSRRSEEPARTTRPSELPGLAYHGTGLSRASVRSGQSLTGHMAQTWAVALTSNGQVLLVLSSEPSRIAGNG
jgi:hypothetical protein